MTICHSKNIMTDFEEISFDEIMEDSFSILAEEINISDIMDVSENKEQKVFPILPVRNLVMFPKVVIPITAGREMSIQLLEEIKHIFGMPNVCFVVSTNIDQLSHSTRAVYGGEFDANGYLKRFFDQGFTLPEPDRERYVELLMKETNILKNRDLSLGLPDRIEPSNKRKATYSISFVFDALDLDLRSQKQIFATADIVASSIDEKKKIYVIWLFFLVSLSHKKPKDFNLLAMKENGVEEIKKILDHEINQNIKVEYLEYSRQKDMELAVNLSLYPIIECYCNWLNQSASQIAALNTQKYPYSNAIDIQDETPRFKHQFNGWRPSISKYIKLVKYAGYIRENKT